MADAKMIVASHHSIRTSVRDGMVYLSMRDDRGEAVEVCFTYKGALTTSQHLARAAEAIPGKRGPSPAEQVVGTQRAEEGLIGE